MRFVLINIPSGRFSTASRSPPKSPTQSDASHSGTGKQTRFVDRPEMLALILRGNCVARTGSRFSLPPCLSAQRKLGRNLLIVPPLPTSSMSSNFFPRRIGKRRKSTGGKTERRANVAGEHAMRIVSNSRACHSRANTKARCRAKCQFNGT